MRIFMKNRYLKKIFLFLFFIFTSFAFATEISFTPNFGFSLYSVHNYEQRNIDSSDYIQLSNNKGDFLFPTPTLGLDISFTHENSGFTFMLNNSFSFPTKLYVVKGFGNRKENYSGITWDGQMIFGYTYGVRQKMQFTGGAGFGFACNALNLREDGGNNAPPYYNLGLALNVGYKYYFTDKVGIGVNIYDLIGFSAVFIDRGTPSLSGDPNKTRLDGMLGLGNLFTLKIGVAFRL